MNEPIYDLALGDYPPTWVRIACRDCQRYCCYRFTGLVARYGCNITLFDIWAAGGRAPDGRRTLVP